MCEKCGLLFFTRNHACCVLGWTLRIRIFAMIGTSEYTNIHVKEDITTGTCCEINIVISEKDTVGSIGKYGLIGYTINVGLYTAHGQRTYGLEGNTNWK